MNLLYNSDHFAVLQISWAPASAEQDTTQPAQAAVPRGGYEIVDKLARKGVFIEGDLARHFLDGVQALVKSEPQAEALDDYIARYTELAQQPVTLH